MDSVSSISIIALWAAERMKEKKSWRQMVRVSAVLRGIWRRFVSGFNCNQLASNLISMEILLDILDLRIMMHNFYSDTASQFPSH